MNDYLIVGLVCFLLGLFLGTSPYYLSKKQKYIKYMRSVIND